MTEAEAEMSGAGNGDGDGMPGNAATALERRYRRLLLLLPRTYRADRGEEILTVLMDSAPERRRWPKPSEALSLATHGLKVRSGLSTEGIPSESARPLMRAVALLGTLYFSFLSAISLAAGLQWHWGIYVSDINHSDLDGHHHPIAEIVLVEAAGLLWLAAYVALLLGWRRVVRVLGFVLLVLAATQVTGWYTALAALPPLIVAGALVSTGWRPIDPAPRTRWWFAAPAPVAAGVGYLGWTGYGEFGPPASVGPLAAVAAAIVVGGALRVWRRPEWALAAAVIGGMAGGQRALDANHYPYWQGGMDPQLRVILVGEAVLVLAALYAIFRQRRAVLAAGSGEAA